MEAERMTLIVETGEGVPTANSYVDIDFIRAYAASRRVPLSNDNEIIEGFAIDAMDLIEARKFKGVRTYTDQPLAFPRSGVITEDGQYATNAIPSILKRAQAALVVYRSQGVSFFATENVEGAVKREKIGPIETEYFDGASSFAPSVPLADVLLEPLERGQGRFSLFTVRV
jgi:hypothetical protein